MVLFCILNVLSVSLLLKWEVSFTGLHTTQECFFHPHELDLPSPSTLADKVRTRWSLRLLSFLKPIISTFVKTALNATLGISKKCYLGKLDNKPDKKLFCFVLFWYFLYPVGCLLKNLLPLKFVYEPLACNSFLLTTFPDHYIFYLKN